MQITKLELNNFSSYEGVNTFDFSVEDDKPIILIGGQNGAGKTSLFIAIKIALYGPLAFGYTGYNSYYSKKIRGLINNKAFQSKDFTSGVKIEIKQKKERAIVTYTIIRNWRIEETHIEEEYAVYEDNRELDESERILFESFLLSIIPVDLFDFFLFDGEEIGNIFSGDSYNKFLKKSMLTICGIDDFEILHSFCNSYTGRKNNAEEQTISEEYTVVEQKLSETDCRITECQNAIERLETEKDELLALIEQKQAEFIRSGGIPKKEADALEEKAAKLDKKRENITRDMKAFFEDLMPFVIMKDMIPSLKTQSRYEEKATIYDYVRNMLSRDFIAGLLDEHTEGKTADSVDTIYDAIIKKFEVSSGIVDDIIFGFSDSERGKVFHLAASAEDYDKKMLVENIIQKDRLYKEAIEIRQKLRNALSEEDAKKYTDEITNARHRIEIIELETTQKQAELDMIKSERESTEKKLDDIKEKLREITQDRHVLDLTNRISIIMEELISSSMESIRQQLAERIVNNLQQIYRKENLISIVKISEDFRFELYQTQNYSISDLKALLSNLGKKEFFRLLGPDSISIIMKYSGVSDESELETSMTAFNENSELALFKRIELNMLSKGERQIFILALYWAIVQVSGRQIPFIIDTPYARIDANHREEISSKFFPNISKQVVILSTDEEITKEYYEMITPYISRAYLLQNNKADNCTTVSDGYFFEEDRK